MRLPFLSLLLSLLLPLLAQPSLALEAITQATPPTQAPQALFGHQVSLNSHGWLAVGAPGSLIPITLFDCSRPSQGCPLLTSIPFPKGPESFGLRALALNDQGWLVVTAYLGKGDGGGILYDCSRAAQGGGCVVGFDVPNPEEPRMTAEGPPYWFRSVFGASVAINSLREVVVGAPHSLSKGASGRGYLYRCREGQPCYPVSPYLDDATYPDVDMGKAVAINDRSVVALGSTRAVLLFDCAGASCVLLQRIPRLAPTLYTSNLGAALALSNQGKLVVGFPQAVSLNPITNVYPPSNAPASSTSPGTAFIYSCPEGSPCVLQDTLQRDSSSKQIDSFGGSVDINDHGWVVIGAADYSQDCAAEAENCLLGEAMIFDCSGPSCTFVGRLETSSLQGNRTFIGRGVAINSANMAAVGCPGATQNNQALAGAVEVLDVSQGCPSEVFGNAEWPQTHSSGVAMGKCLQGYSGNPQRTCIQGVWSGSVSDPCEAPTAGNCKAMADYAHASYKSTPPNSWAVGTCLPGFSGKPLLFCRPDGAWRSLVVNHCQRV